MADIMLHTSSANQVTCVSNIFIDDFMKDANGEYVKIYLYLLRCLGRDGFDFSISELADRLDHTEKDVMRAFTYWEKVGLLRLEYTSDNELSGICLVDVQGHDQVIAPVVTTTFTPISFTTQTESVTENIPQVSTTITTPTKPNYSKDDIIAFSQKDGIDDLIFATEYYLGRPLGSSESTSLLYWHDSLNMSADLIQYLVEYCISNGHKSFHYMDTVARNWTDDGITTVEAAMNETRSHSSTVYTVMKAMGISGRDLIKSELDYIDKWTSQYKFSIDIICDACKRTVLSTNKPSFKYADSILASWFESGATSLDDILKLDEKHVRKNAPKPQASSTSKNGSQKKTTSNNNFNNFNQREFDYDALAKSLLK